MVYKKVTNADGSCWVVHSNTGNGAAAGDAIFPEWGATLGEVSDQTK